MQKPRDLKPLPPVTNVEASAAVTMIGGVVFNLLVHHALHVRAEQRAAVAAKALDIARAAVEVFSFAGGSSEERANTKALVLTLLANIGSQVQDELDRRSIEPSSIN
jgi:hypothetical protein